MSGKVRTTSHYRLCGRALCRAWVAFVENCRRWAALGFLVASVLPATLQAQARLNGKPAGTGSQPLGVWMRGVTQDLADGKAVDLEEVRNRLLVRRWSSTEVTAYFSGFSVWTSPMPRPEQFAYYRDFRELARALMARAEAAFNGGSTCEGLSMVQAAADVVRLPPCFVPPPRVPIGLSPHVEVPREECWHLAYEPLAVAALQYFRDPIAKIPCRDAATEAARRRALADLKVLRAQICSVAKELLAHLNSNRPAASFNFSARIGELVRGLDAFRADLRALATAQGCASP
ncbi:MAG: hypothetical protein ACP5VE_06120 [Chthonomonadales bacterium]